MQHPRADFDNELVSSIEELDPEPSDRRGFSYAREALVGISLILVVLAWGATQWWHDQTMSGYYRAGTAAAAAKDWDTARAQFAAASGYLDADSKAAGASKTIAARNDAYQATLSAIINSQWAPALRAANAVEAIQPGYRDSHDLATVAHDRVYSSALEESVVLRTDTDTPGLYYYGSEWVRLPGSDKASHVAASGPSGWIAYDIPSNFRLPRDYPYFPVHPYLQAPVTPGLRGRALMAANVSGSNRKFVSIALDPTYFNLLICGQKGIWGLRYKNSFLPAESSLRFGFDAFEIAYEEYGSDFVSPITLPSPDWTVMDFSPSGDRLLLAKAPASGDTGPVQLYTAAPDGTNLRLVYSATGTLQRAQFSPDGRYVLVLAHRPLDDYRHETQDAILLDTTGLVPARTLLENVTDSITGRVFPTMGAVFVPSGPYAGKILLAGWGFNSSNLSLLDPADPTTPIAAASGPSSPVGRVWVASDPRSDYLLVAWQDGLGGALPYADAVTGIAFAPSTRPVVGTFPLATGEAVTGIWLKGDNIVFSAEPYAPYTQGPLGYALRSLPVAALGLPKVLPTPLLTRGPSDSAALGGVDWRAGTGLFAYVNGDQLHVRTYDGTTDLTLDNGVAGFFDTEPQDYHVIR